MSNLKDKKLMVVEKTLAFGTDACSNKKQCREDSPLFRPISLFACFRRVGYYYLPPTVNGGLMVELPE
ncbi:MAG: hypothetical protein KJ964_11150 [Verrucomicrobia bacterium]|nr:hypothetical protein [Verrucomicrobiota bacterium]MBU1735880.1 hypothetical protein [Verrucomicrobiota bacterium]MBU1855933.1 hypothetical protein [Verrucomicrobiota bacterium]